MGQNPQNVIKQYQEAGYLPAIKMSIIEEKVISKLFDEKLENNFRIENELYTIRS